MGDLLQAVESLPVLLRSKDVANFMSVCLRTVRRWIKSGRLGATKTHPGSNGRHRIPRESLRKMLMGGK